MASAGKGHWKKGAGKGKEYGRNGSSVQKKLRKESVERQPLKVSERLKLPKYFSILKRSESDGVTLDDLDGLQLDLELLLSSVAVRYRTLNAELQNFRCDEVESSEVSLSAGKSKATEDACDCSVSVSQSGKKFEESIVEEPSSSTECKKGKTYLGAQTDVSFGGDSHLPKVPVRRYEAPNKFWTSINPFCAQITTHDVKFLEELIEEIERNDDYVKIPPLGNHYSIRWAQEELMNEQCASHCEGNSKGKRTVCSEETETLLKKAFKVTESRRAGSLLERISSALMEETDIGGAAMKDAFGVSSPRVKSSSYRLLSRDAPTLEQRLLKALEAEEIVKCDRENVKDIERDEILREMRSCQSELRVINKLNVENLEHLLKLAKAEVGRQELKRKLEEVDNEILEQYKKVLAAKQKKGGLSEEEVKRCWKILQEQEELTKELTCL